MTDRPSLAPTPGQILGPNYPTEPDPHADVLVENWRPGAAVVDCATGLTAAFAIMAALAQRARDGRGQHVDVAMQDVALTLAGAAVLRVTETGEDVTPEPPARDEGHPGLGAYDAADGALTLGALIDRQLRRLGAGWNARDALRLAQA